MSSGLMRIRLAYTKLGKVRFLGHRDVARLWERTLRKADIPVAMSTGFTPRARISFGLALPTGAESLIELLDIAVDPAQGGVSCEAPDLDHWRNRIDEALPSGFAVTHVGEVVGGNVSLQESVTASSWILLIDHPDIARAVDALRGSESVLLERERKGEMRRDDIRQGILEIEIARADHLDALLDVWPGDPLRSGSATAISTMLTTSGRGIRPTELVQALIPGEEPWDHLTRVLRTQQWIDKDGQRIDVLSGSAARPQVCA